jgi:glutamine synthetase
LHEKPYASVAGSGKHNNWSIGTDGGKNLLKPGKTPAENKQFLLILAAVVKAVDDYQDLLRLSVAHPGNDHRLGGNEAPPAVISMFIGDDLQDVVTSIISGTDYKGKDRTKMNLGIPSVPTFTKDTTDRNRTSPFAFTGNKFEFRMPGSSQNMAMPNIVLNTIVAESFRQFADVLEKAEHFDEAVEKLIKETLTAHSRIIFNGNGYSEEWKQEAARRGLLDLKTSVDAYQAFASDKNIALFTRHGVMSEVEIRSRQEILFENYAKLINIEAQTMVEMATRDILPAVNAYTAEVAAGASAKAAAIKGVNITMETELVSTLSDLVGEGYEALKALKKADADARAEQAGEKMALAFSERVLPAMQTLRKKVDAMEELTASDYWPLPTYGDMMFRI